MPVFGPPRYGGPFLWGTGGSSDSFGDVNYEITRKRGARPIVRVEHIAVDGTVTDISRYYVGGGNITREKERAPDEIQAGDFDITLANHDDYFSEYKSGSLFYDTQYHLSQIKISAAFISPTGMTDYYVIGIGYIDEIQTSGSDSKVVLRCRDRIHKLLDGKLHLRSTDEVPSAGSNTGNGVCSAIATKPFATQNETWTLTCTTLGGDGVAIFSVVGSVSGNIGNATSGTEFSDATAGIKFTVTAGTVEWVVDDSFTFQTFQHPEWSAVNPAKIIWSILTGYNYDTGLEEDWSASALDFDHTLSTANTDLDYTSFQTSVTDLAEFSLTGYVDYDESAQEVIQGLLLLFLGALYTNGDGKISLKTWTPKQSSLTREFSDAKKISNLGYVRSIAEIINYVRMAYKKTNSWQFTDAAEVYDGWYVAKDTDSIAKYGKLSTEYSVRWYMSGGTHVQLCSTRLLARYHEPPLVLDFVTGADGLLSDIGDRAYVTDQKYGFDAIAVELSRVTKVIDSRPMHVEIQARRDEGAEITYGYYGSRADEGDGLSPQAATYGAASDSDKGFCYLHSGYKMY